MLLKSAVSLHTSQMAHQKGVYPTYSDTKLGAFLHPLDGIPVYRSIKFAGGHLITQKE